jgi:ABC-type nitrate/sulfonate/bicarbonate transport system permease component
MAMLTATPVRGSLLRRVTTRLVRFGHRFTVLALILVVWEVAARTGGSVFLPPVSDIAGRFVELWLSGSPRKFFTSDLLREHLFASGSRIVLGWGAAIVVGVLVGTMIGLVSTLRLMTAPMLRFAMSVPASALLPIAIGFFGITNMMNSFLIAFASVWTILINTADGVGAIDQQFRRTARSMRLGRFRLFFKVILPAASPQIFAGLRTSVGIVLAMMVLGELYAASDGVGFFIALSDRQFHYLDMWAGVALVALVGIVLNLAFSVVERRVLAWHRLQRSDAH